MCKIHHLLLKPSKTGRLVYPTLILKENQSYFFQASFQIFQQQIMFSPIYNKETKICLWSAEF